ncbi:ubiquitin-conjugating enzyme E2 13 [Diutina catenulata]
MSHPFHKRLLKEYRDLVNNPPPGITLVDHRDDLTHFVFRIAVFNHALYPSSDGYHLRIEITPDYPVDAPQVTFVLYEDLDADDMTPKIPVHPHVYSNGHICLNLLGDDWTPACSIHSIVLSIQSMLASNQANERPPDDANYVRHAPKNPKQTSWLYHDDTV